MPVSRKRVRFPLSRGIIAAPASAWGADFDILVSAERTAPFTIEGAWAVVDICGPLCQRADWCFDGYDAVIARVKAALTAESDTIVLRIDSPGGDFPGSLEAARDIRSMVAAAGKRLIAFTDSQALSAGYGLACAASEIVITPSAYVGSIGVWAALADMTEANRMSGLNVVIVPSGERKADRNPNVPVTADTVAALQSEVDAMAALFFAAVSDSRKVPLAAIEGHQGAMLIGAQAVAARLADRVVNSWSEFVNTPQGRTTESNMTKAEMRKALAAMAAEGDEDAKRSLKAWDDSEKKDSDAKAASEDEDKKDGDAKASSDEDSDKKKDVDAKAAKASDEDDSSEKKKDGDAKAAALSLHALAAELHAMKAAAASEKESTERAKLLASRPDITGTVRASLERAPIAFVRDACANWPRAKGAVSASVAATTPGGTRGEAQKDDGETPLANLGDDDFIARKMNGSSVGGGVETRRGGRELVLGFMSPKDVEAAAARLAKKEGV